jgi:LPXTG-motif cell wall-anchored protein
MGLPATQKRLPREYADATPPSPPAASKAPMIAAVAGVGVVLALIIGWLLWRRKRGRAKVDS